MDSYIHAIPDFLKEICAQGFFFNDFLKEICVFPQISNRKSFGYESLNADLNSEGPTNFCA